jgi:dimethylhistidine N-methyltransferase
MNQRHNSRTEIHIQPPDASVFMRDVLVGLGRKQKTLPSKYFYDQEGTRLFDKICGLDEYYLTRTETNIMEENIGEISDLLGTGILLVEFGSGSSVKTGILLDNLDTVSGYIPIDISQEYLNSAVMRLNHIYPSLSVYPILHDYTLPVSLPALPGNSSGIIAFFPGSTVGNLHPGEAVRFLRNIRRMVGETGGLLIGIDLKKDPSILHRAYNDSAGVTEAFNKNILVRVNMELGGNFRTDLFKHYAFYNPAHGRIEMHLVSLRRQTVRIRDNEFFFERGESIHTENSYKYSICEFGIMASRAGMKIRKIWTDQLELFGVLYMKPA